MEPDELHDLTAAYALDALDEAEERAYEAHLAECPACREELASLSHATTALALGVEAPVPSSALRERILEAAVADRAPALAPVISLASRRVHRWTMAAAAVAACTAVGLGVWSTTLVHSLHGDRSTLRLLAQRVPVSGGHGNLYVSQSGDAVLQLADLGRAPRRRVYEIWLLGNGNPVPAGLFHGTERAVGLQRRVPPGATVEVTVEPEGGSLKPSTKPLFVAQNA